MGYYPLSGIGIRPKNQVSFWILYLVHNDIQYFPISSIFLSSIFRYPVSGRISYKVRLKTLWLLIGCYNYSSHPILLLSSRDMYRRKHSALLHLCQYVFPHVKPPWQLPNHFHLWLRVSGNALPNHLSSVPTLPVFR